MGIPVQCDICKRKFRLRPDNILDVYIFADDKTPPRPPDGEPDDYAFVCRKCEKAFVFLWDEEGF